MVVLLNLQGAGVGCQPPIPILSPAMFTALPLGRHTSGRWRTRSNGNFMLRCAIAEPSGEPAPLGQKTQYRDGLLEKVFMALFARKMEKFAVSPSGSKSQSQGNASSAWNFDYDSFVNVSRRVMQGRSRLQQQQVVREVLLSMLPPGAPAQFRKLFPPTKWAAEFNAALTVPFFHWVQVSESDTDDLILQLPANNSVQVVEVEINGEKQRSGVHIKKCRYLENSGCVGMCVNMCKIPTQDFFTNEFGLPLTMNPNFEDMSCDMVYGQMPPSFEEDPVSKQPCYANLCKTEFAVNNSLKKFLHLLTAERWLQVLWQIPAPVFVLSYRRDTISFLLMESNRKQRGFLNNIVFNHIGPTHSPFLIVNSTQPAPAPN